MKQSHKKDDCFEIEGRIPAQRDPDEQTIHDPPIALRECQLWDEGVPAEKARQNTFAKSITQ